MDKEKFDDIRGNTVSDDNLFIGFTTKQKLKSIFKNDPKNDLVTPEKVEEFYKGVREFYCTAVEYAVQNLPLNDIIIKNSKFVNFSNRLKADFDDVLKIITNLGLKFEDNELDIMSVEFSKYQLLNDEDIDEAIWKEAKEENGHYRMDIIWGFLFKKKNADGSLCFKYLSQVVESVLILPHSNATSERVFSMVRKNKTDTRGNMKVDNTLSSIITVKMSSLNISNFDPPKELLRSAKQSTMLYNKEHSELNKKK